MSNELTTSQKIAHLNDAFRQNLELYFLTGQVVTTAAIAELPDNDKSSIFNKVKHFDAFSEDNDPYGEHDFGSFRQNGEKIFWKIDAYDMSLRYGSEDPANPAITKRILTIMYAHEY